MWALAIACSGPPVPANTTRASPTLGYTFGWVPSGTFTMGRDRPTRRPDHDLAHEVTLTRGFWLGLREVTQGQWADVLGQNPVAARCPTNEAGTSQVGRDLPVWCVSWCEGLAFADRLSAQDGLVPAYTNVAGCAEHPERVAWDPASNGYRLPTEAEWERAAALGRVADPPNPCVLGNIADATAPRLGLFGESFAECADGYPALAPVGVFPPDRLGRYDLFGNVSEWCWDAYGRYPLASATDPVGVSSWEAEDGHSVRGLTFYDGPGTSDWVPARSSASAFEYSGVRLAQGPYGAAAPLD